MSRRGPNVQFIAGPDGRPAFAVLAVEDYYALLEGAPASPSQPEPWRYEPPAPPLGSDFQMPAPPPQPERPPMPDHVRAKIDSGGNPIAVWREERGLTREALAGFIGFQEDDIEAFETGEVTPSVEICQMLAMALDVDFEDVIPI